MSGTLVNLIIQLIAGVIGGNAAGKSLTNYDLGAVGNTIAGAIGGGRRRANSSGSDSRPGRGGRRRARH